MGRAPTSRFITSLVSSDAISCPPTAAQGETYQSMVDDMDMQVPAMEGVAAARTIPHKTQGEALEGLIPGYEVVADRVDDEPQEVVLLYEHGRNETPSSQIPLDAGDACQCSSPHLVQEDRACHVPDLLLCVSAVVHSLLATLGEHASEHSQADRWRCRTWMQG